MGLASVVGVGNGAQALFAAFGTGYEAGRYAVWYDVGRHVIMPAGFLYVFIVMFIRKLRNRHDPDIRTTRGIKRFPLWLAVFVFFWVLACLHFFKEPAHHAIFNLVKWDFSLAAAALGLSLSFKDITIQGIKGFLVTCIAGGVKSLVAECLTKTEYQLASQPDTGEVFFKSKIWDPNQSVIVITGSNWPSVEAARKDYREQWLDEFGKWFDMELSGPTMHTY